MLTVNFLNRLDCVVLSTVLREDDEDAWLKTRTNGIGGSDIGTICGVNPFSSARLLYLEKLGMYENDSDQKKAASERMHFGQLLEPIVADEYARRTGKKIAVSPATYQHKDIPWALANIDRFIVDDNGVPYGILECKTSSEFMNSEWENSDVPLSYIYQVMWYMFVTGLRYGAIATLVGGNKFYCYEILYDEELVKNILLPSAEKFWFENVKKLIEPEIDGSQASVDYIKQKYAECVKDSEIQLIDEVINELANTIVVSKAEVKRLEGIIAEAENRIKEKMQEHEIAYTTDHIIKWSPRSQRRVNTDILKANYPDVYEACKKQINYRVFTVRQVG